MMTQRQWAFWALLLPPLFWSGNMLLGRLTVPHVPPLTLNLLRWALAALLFAPFSYQYVRRDFAQLWQARWRVLGLALCAATAYNSFLYFGLRGTSIVNAALINASTPAVVGLLSFVLLKNKLSVWQLLGAFVSLAGVLQIALRGDWFGLMRLDVHVGDAFIFAGVIAYALYTVLMRFAPRVHPFAFMQAIFSLGSLGTLVWMGVYALTNSGSLAITASWRDIVWPVLYMAVFASIGATFFWNFGVRQVGAISAGYFINLIPVFSIAWAVVFVNETVQSYQWFGMILVCCGIGLALFQPSSAQSFK